jgi:hypothetical protein
VAKTRWKNPKNQLLASGYQILAELLPLWLLKRLIQAKSKSQELEARS